MWSWTNSYKHYLNSQWYTSCRGRHTGIRNVYVLYPSCFTTQVVLLQKTIMELQRLFSRTILSAWRVVWFVPQVTCAWAVATCMLPRKDQSTSEDYSSLLPRFALSSCKVTVILYFRFSCNYIISTWLPQDLLIVNIIHWSIFVLLFFV